MSAGRQSALRATAGAVRGPLDRGAARSSTRASADVSGHAAGTRRRPRAKPCHGPPSDSKDSPAGPVNAAVVAGGFRGQTRGSPNRTAGSRASPPDTSRWCRGRTRMRRGRRHPVVADPLRRVRSPRRQAGEAGHDAERPPARGRPRSAIRHGPFLQILYPTPHRRDGFVWSEAQVIRAGRRRGPLEARPGAWPQRGAFFCPGPVLHRSRTRSHRSRPDGGGRFSRRKGSS